MRLLAARVFHTIVTFQKKSGPGTITTGWIPNKLDSGFQWLDSGFQSHGFRIPQAKIAWIPDSGLPYMGRPRDTLLVSVIREGILAADPFFLSTSFARRLANLGSTAKLLARITHKVRLLAGYTIFDVFTVDKVIDSHKTFIDNLTYSATFCLFIDATHVLHPGSSTFLSFMIPSMHRTQLRDQHVWARRATFYDF